MTTKHKYTLFSYKFIIILIENLLMTMNTLKFTWAFASLLLLIIFTLFPIATCHLPQCSFEGINLDKCMDLDQNQASFDSCCNALNQIIQAGYYCLCAILGSSSPLITNSLVLPFSNCFISIPPLTHCQGNYLISSLDSNFSLNSMLITPFVLIYVT